MRTFALLFLAHIAGDYVFQPESLAKKKEDGLGWVLLHTLIYAAVCMLTLLLLGGGYVWAAIIAAGSHLVIDVVKWLVIRSPKNAKCDLTVFCVDQALHLAIILAASIWVTGSFKTQAPPYVIALGRVMGFDVYKLIGCIAMGLAVTKPANVFIRKMLAAGRAEDQKDDENSAAIRRARTGRYIGCLERLLMLALLYFAQYGSIAIVFTAKSIARFKQLEDREFAEYYLFGTLLSAASAVGVFIIMKLFGTV